MEFTVCGVDCAGLNGGDMFKHSQLCREVAEPNVNLVYLDRKEGGTIYLRIWGPHVYDEGAAALTS